MICVAGRQGALHAQPKLFGLFRPHKPGHLQAAVVQDGAAQYVGSEVRRLDFRDPANAGVRVGQGGRPGAVGGLSGGGGEPFQAPAHQLGHELLIGFGAQRFGGHCDGACVVAAFRP